MRQFLQRQLRHPLTCHGRPPARKMVRPLEARSIASSDRSCAASSASLGRTTGMRTVPRATRRGDRRPGAGRAAVEAERRLAAAHRQVDVGEDARVEQRAVQVAAGVVDAVALAQRVEGVALAGVHASRELERVVDAAVVGDARRAAGRQRARRRGSRRRRRRCGSPARRRRRMRGIHPATSANAGFVGEEFLGDAGDLLRARARIRGPG